MTMTPSTTLHPLHRADGSATFTNPLFTILAAVNGPLEAPRRDELPDAALLDIHIRPAHGVGGPRERWIEYDVLAPLLRHVVVLTRTHPRALIQVIVQVVREEELGRQVRDVAFVAAVVNAVGLALVEGGIAVGKMVAAAWAGVDGEGRVVVEPEKGIGGNCWRSVHAMAFTAGGEMVLGVQEGVFTLEMGKRVTRELRRVCVEAMAKEDQSGDENMETKPWLREALESDARRANAWRGLG